MRNRPKMLNDVLSDGGTIEYRNGEKGVRLKCGWWVRVLPISEYGQPLPKKNNARPRKTSKKDLSALAKIKEQHGDDWHGQWFDYCFSKMIGKK